MIQEFGRGFQESVGLYGLGFMAGQMLTFIGCVFLPVVLIIWFVQWLRFGPKKPKP